jgi:hypothetical protein
LTNIEISEQTSKFCRESEKKTIMNSSEIENVLNGRQRWKWISFLGCFPADQLPKRAMTTNHPVCFLANTDISNEGGSHWVAFVINGEGQLEYFCPLGISYHHWPLFYNYIKNVIRPDKILFNLTRIQSLNSQTCGQLCIEFVVKRDNGQSFVNILNKFSKNTMSNDIEAIHFVKKLKTTKM